MGDKVTVRTFHSWCHQLLKAHQVPLPERNLSRDGYYCDIVNRVIQGVAEQTIPVGQYDAILVDEGHDFKPEWLELIVKMVNPRTNSLLVLFDDAQSIYDTGDRLNFSFKSVGIQAQGRTTVLRINYRNTQEILEFASHFAKEQLMPSDAGEDGVPRLQPVSAGHRGRKPALVKLPSLNDVVQEIIEKFKAAHQDGTPYGDMAILYRTWHPVGAAIKAAFAATGIGLAEKDETEFGGEQNWP